MLQVVLIGFFMFKNHPFNNVYFNNFVSHEPEYLRKHYEVDGWGSTMKQGLDYLDASDELKTIKIYCYEKDLLYSNIVLLPENDRNRFQYANKENADYLVTNFRFHPYDYPSYKTEYSINVLNSTILCVYKLEKDPAKQRQFDAENVFILSKFLADNPDFEEAQSQLSAAYFHRRQYDSAEVHGLRAISLNPKSPVALNNLANIYMTKKNYLIGVEMYREAIRLNPDFVDPYINIAVYFLNGHQFDSGIYYLYRAISVDPDYTKANEYLARVYRNIGNMDSAVKYEIIAQKNDPGFKL